MNAPTTPSGYMLGTRLALCRGHMTLARRELSRSIHIAKALDAQDVVDGLEFSLLALEKAYLRIEKANASQLVDSDSNSSVSNNPGVGSEHGPIDLT